MARPVTPPARAQQRQSADLFADMSHHKELDAYLQSLSTHESMDADTASQQAEGLSDRSPISDIYTTAPAHITPLRVSPSSSRHKRAKPSVSKISEATTTPTSSVDDVFTAIEVGAIAPLFGSDVSRPSSTSSGGAELDAKTSSRSRNTLKQLETLVLSTSKVERVCFIHPRAGPFEGQFVALILTTATSTPHLTPGRDTTLIPPTEIDAAQRQVHGLRTAVLEWGGDSPRPDVWIVLQSMALDGRGEPDARLLQTWVQNASQDMEERIMSMQIFRKRPTMGRAARGLPADEQDKLTRMSEVEGAMDETDAINSESEFFPLSLMQQMFFRTTLNRSIESAAVSGSGFRFSQSILLRVRGGAELADIEAAIDVLTCHHAMLRARFRLTGEGWAQVIAPAATRSYRFEHKYADATADDVDEGPDGEEDENDDEDGVIQYDSGKFCQFGDVKRRTRRKRRHRSLLEIMEQAQGCLNVFRGPVFAAQHIRTRDNQQLLYLVAHHLVVDVASWRVLLHDLDELLQRGTLASGPSLGFTRWVGSQSVEANQKLVDPVLPQALGAADLAYWQLQQQPNCYADTAQLGFCLPPDLASSLLAECSTVLRTEASDVFVAALLHSFGQTFPDRSVPTVWKQHHGRGDGAGLDKTVGWFTTLSPFSIPAADGETDVVHLVKLAKDTRRALEFQRSNNSNLTSKFSTLQPHMADTAPSIPVEIMFNCVETLRQLSPGDGMLEPVTGPDGEFESLVSDIGPDVGRIALFEVSVVIDEAGARVEVLYNTHAAHRNRIAAWVSAFEQSVLEAIACLSVMEPQLTLAEAPFLETSYDAMARLATTRLAAIGLDSVNNIDSLNPVDPVQHEILIAQAQDQSCFHVSCTYELVVTGVARPIDATRLCDAWASLVAKHASLRTIFIDSISENGLFDKVVLREVSPVILFVDSTNPVQTLASVPAMEPVPSRPRHRLSVSRSPTKTYLRLEASQAICDLASIHTLICQLGRIYAGEMVHVTDFPTPRQHYHISSEDASNTIQAWGITRGAIAPCLFPRLALQQDGQVHTRAFDLDVSPRLVLNFCKDLGVEPPTLFKMAWALVLRTFVGTDKVSFGYQFPGREHAWRQPIGSFAALAPCLADVSGTQTIAECLRSLQAIYRDSSRSDLPTVGEIEHALGLVREPLFNTCISIQDASQSLCTAVKTKTDSLTWEPLLVSSSLDANCDISLCVTRLEGQFRGDITFRHLTGDQAESVAYNFENALGIVMGASNCPVSEIDLFTERDYRQITSPDWDPDQTDTKVSACLHQLILQQARIRPHATAISSWDGSLSYRQLQYLVSKLAAYLVQVGVAPGMLVPLVLDKCRWSPIVMLAVLQAGGCFVALDSQDLAIAKTLISQLAPPIVIVTEPAWKHIGPIVNNCLLVNQNSLATMPAPTGMPLREPLPEQAACAFLSPGTNRPRGIFFTHQSLCSILSVQGPALRIGDGSRVLQLSAFNVDIALVEVFGTLLHGGRICIPSGPERASDLEGVINRMDVNWSYMTPILARRTDPRRVPSLKTICFRTRSLDRETYTPWLPHAEVLLAYGGPDLCPLAISVLQIYGPNDTDMVAPPLMGRFLVLNPKDPKRMVPVGAMGELAIDSPLVTPHRFVPGQPLIDPECLREPQAKPKWRYMRTGHIARHLDRGYIRLMATKQDEIHFNGIPVVVAEIERRLRLCLANGVEVAVENVVTSDSASVLVAFLDFGTGSSREPFDLTCLGPGIKQRLFAARSTIESSLDRLVRDDGKASLPWQCIPSVFVPVRGLPLSVSLKVNRRNLRRLVASLTYAQLMGLSDGQYPDMRSPAQINKPLPLTEAEESMRLIWASVLGTLPDGIKPTDSFFDAGGDRLLAARMVIACRHDGFDVSIRHVLGGATLTDICRSTSSAESIEYDDDADISELPPEMLVGERQVHGAYQGLVKLVLAPQVGVSSHDVLDAAEATWQQTQSLESSLYRPRGDMGCLVLDINGPVQLRRLEAACEALTLAHPILRTSFAIHECRAYQVSLSSFRAPFKHERCSASELDAGMTRVMQQDQRLPLRLGSPVTEFTHLEDQDGKQGKLLMRFSTAQMSEGAVPLLAHDLARLYENPDSILTRGSFLQHARTIQAAAQRRDSVRHWSAKLAGARITQVIPQPRPRGPVADQMALHETIELAMLEDEGVGFDVVLKTAWAMILARLSATADVVFGELVEGRRRMSLGPKADARASSMIGPLEYMVPVRVRFPESAPSPLQMMRLVQRDCTCSLAHEVLDAQAIIRECTDWPGWTQFSTVVRHQPQSSGETPTIFQLGDATMTYRMFEPPVRAVPDIMVTSTAVGPSQIALALEYSASRVPGEFAAAVMDLLVGTVKGLTCLDAMHEQNLPCAGDYINRSPRLLSGNGGEVATDYEPTSSRISKQHRRTLEAFIASAWAEALYPKGQGTDGAHLEACRFYDVSGSVLPAYLLAGRLNHGLSRLDIGGLESVHVTPQEMIANPTMPSQMALIVRKMHELDAVSKLARRRTVVVFGPRDAQQGQPADDIREDPEPAPLSTEPSMRDGNPRSASALEYREAKADVPRGRFASRIMDSRSRR
ncbi:hypothetical protein HIM_01192 [Hirsutella minnesotensis 3608]|nr:hypothetical protein HIM_01192 [Hirsutella minnesotensis 3608]